ncbi:hypothetical protein P9112_008325 [Eukaryota sp. TZLM1-RC]
MDSLCSCSCVQHSPFCLGVSSQLGSCLSNNPGVGIHSISTASTLLFGSHTLLLTYSGEVYGLGHNDYGQILYDGPGSIKLPIKLPLTNIISISAGHCHSLALSSEGHVLQWGCIQVDQFLLSSSESLPITPINIPYSIKEVYGGEDSSFALTQEGQVVKWRCGKSFELIEGLENIVFISVYNDSFVAVDYFNNVYYSTKNDLHLLNVSKIPRILSKNSVILNNDFLLLIDSNGDVWEVDFEDSFIKKPTKVKGLTNIVSVTGCERFFLAINDNGKVFVWGELSGISNVYQDSDEPRCIRAFTNIEGISVGEDFLFAYNKNTVLAWGRNFFGQLGTGDLIDRPQPVKVFGSEILGSFRHPRQPLDRMFSGLVRLIYSEYFQSLKILIGNHPYTKARFLIKCSVSKKVAKFAKEVIIGFEFLKDPQELKLNDNICDLQLRLSTDFNGPKVINTRIKKLDVYCKSGRLNPQLFTFFPNVEVVKLFEPPGPHKRFNLFQLSHLRYFELDCNLGLKLEQLPTSLVKLLLNRGHVDVDDLSYLTSLQELVVFSFGLSERILKGQISLPQSIGRLEVEMNIAIDVRVQLPNLKEFIIHNAVPPHLFDQQFPTLKFIHLVKFLKDNLSTSVLSPTKLANLGLIKFVKLINSEYLAELSVFPWWIQYTANIYFNRHFPDVFRNYLNNTSTDA